MNLPITILVAFIVLFYVWALYMTFVKAKVKKVLITASQRCKKTTLHIAFSRNVSDKAQEAILKDISFEIMQIEKKINAHLYDDDDDIVNEIITDLNFEKND